MGLPRFLRRAKWDRERSQEIESYVQIETDENLARGMQYSEARAAARRKFGNSTLIREEIYNMNTIVFLETLSRDVRYGARMLRRNPMFTAVALLTLGLGIGANTAVFSVVNSVLLKPLPYPKADELVALRQVAPGAAGLANFADGLLLSPSMYFTYAEQNRTFQCLGVWIKDTASVTGVAEPEQVRTVEVSDGLLETLAVAPAAGRWFSHADQIPRGPETVMLSYSYWQRRFGGDRSAIGRSIRIDSRTKQIVGVMPKGFRVVNTDFDVILPFAFDRNKQILAGFGYHGIGRLRPGVSIARANADIARLIPVWMDSWSNGPGTNPHVYENWRISPAFRPLKEEVIGNIGDVLWVVMGTIGLVMLIACANVTNLLLVRAEARQQELAVRSALGAGTGRIVRELLLETMLIGVMGGAVGTGIAYAGLRVLQAIGPGNLPRVNEISLDARALIFAVVLSLVSALFAGLIPVLKYSAPGIALAMRSAGRTASASRNRHRARQFLLLTQVAMALVLLVSAGLMIRTFQALRNVEPGFSDPKHLQTMRISIPAPLIADPQRVIRLQNEITDKLASIPGVRTAAFTNEMPMEGFDHEWDTIYAENRNYPGDLAPLRLFKHVSPGFFQTAGTRIILGRELTWTDVYGFRPVGIISEKLARELWGSSAAALGKRFRQYPSSPWREVIGVVEDVREHGVHEDAPPIVYWPTMTDHFSGNNAADAIRDVSFVVRSERAGTESFIRQIQQAVWSVNSSLPVASVRTMQEIYDRSMARTSFTLVMLGIAGSMALLLGIVGIYGVISYAVSQRTREIGIRLALGAQQGELKTMFVRQGLALVGIGVTIGLSIAIALTRLMKSLLFGISPLDPLTYAAVALILAAATVIASYLPARRAAAVDPVEALRAE
ncbi:MAG: ABC transporter permease [Acidobacteriaceae bacterium]|nr:ABC transporter permease [Acidobacteriaceae bacterium]MBV9778617.1 ABC transporter permease [Acidobacteriaceae bacterium]